MEWPARGLLFIWVAWLLSWLLASGWTARTATQQSPASRMVEGVPVWCGAFLIAITPRGVLAAPLYAQHAWTEWSMLALTAAGFGLTWWARIHLGRFWSAAVGLKIDHVLVRSGPYGITRHPIYTGLLLAVIATALARDSLAGLMGAGCIWFGLTLKLRHEETVLGARFGPDYAVYKSEVPALIPRLRRRTAMTPGRS